MHGSMYGGIMEEGVCDGRVQTWMGGGVGAWRQGDWENVWRGAYCRFIQAVSSGGTGHWTCGVRMHGDGEAGCMVGAMVQEEGAGHCITVTAPLSLMFCNNPT